MATSQQQQQQHIPDDASSMSDDVFEDVETTQRRREEAQMRHNDYANIAPTLYSDSGGDFTTTTTANSGSNSATSFHRSVAASSGYPAYRASRDALHMYSSGYDPIGTGDTAGGGTNTAHHHHPHYRLDPDYDDGWRSYRYEEVGMLTHRPPPPPQPPPFDDTVNHKTILLGDSGVGKTSFLVQYNTGEFRLGSFSATVGIALTVIMLGDSGVGKTCLLIRFRDGKYLPNHYITTVGIDFRNKVVVVDGTRVKLQIWDTAGQERFRSVTHAYYRDAHALLLLYDVTNKITYDNIRAWLGEIREYAQEDVVIVLIGNKADCSSSERQVKREDGERLAHEHNVPFMETSAKTGLNVELAFAAVARQLKCRGNENGDDGRFNVHEFVRDNTKARTICAQCKAM